MPPVSHIQIWQLVIILLVNLIILQQSLTPLFGFLGILDMVVHSSNRISHLLFALLGFYCSRGILLKRGNQTTALYWNVVERVLTWPAALLQPLIWGLPHLAVLFKLILNFIPLHWPCYWFLHALTPLLLPHVSIAIARRLTLDIVRIHHDPIIIIMEKWFLVVDALAILIGKRFPLRTLENHFLLIFQCSFQMRLTQLIA